jgi:hypothetical protein
LVIFRAVQARAAEVCAMSGRETGYAWAARSIAVGEFLIPIQRTEKAVLARMCDSANPAGIVAYLDAVTIAADLSITKHAVLKVFARLGTCPPFPTKGVVVSEVPWDRRAQKGVKCVRPRTKECAPPGGRCRNHLGILETVEVSIFGSTKKRTYRVVFDHFRDAKNRNPPVIADHRTGDRESPDRLSAVTGSYSSSSSSSFRPVIDEVSGESAAALGSAGGRRHWKSKIPLAPKELESYLCGLAFQRPSSVFGADSAARFWQNVRRGKADATAADAIRVAQALLGTFGSGKRRRIDDYPSVLIASIEGAMLAPAPPPRCTCGNSGECDFCKERFARANAEAKAEMEEIERRRAAGIKRGSPEWIAANIEWRQRRENEKTEDRGRPGAAGAGGGADDGRSSSGDPPAQSSRARNDGRHKTR